MANNSNTIVISFSILILLLLTLLLIVSYNSKCRMDNVEKFYNNDTTSPMIDRNFNQDNGSINTSVADLANKNANIDKPSGGVGNFQPSDPLGNEVYNEVIGGDNLTSLDNMAENQACFPRDRLTAEDLLPKDAANSKWAQLNPVGAGNINDQNYLTAGYHIGINTIGQSLRNANLQLRSEPPNPQQAVSPWNISSIESENRPRQLEIGSSPIY
jgi:hypothetical protein